MDYPDIVVAASSTSYFSGLNSALDPNLFEGDRMRPSIRLELVRLVLGYLSTTYAAPENWVRVWVAGSGVSYQWSAARFPGDLDVLVGVDYVEFRRANQSFAGWSNTEISKELNEGFNQNLTPHLTEWMGLWEVTVYCNPDSYDIKAINPYAAYDLIEDEWTVPPSDKGAPDNPYWKSVSDRDHNLALSITNHYTKALTDLRAATNPAYRVNAEARVKASVEQASALYDEIHGGRKAAFSRVGGGYSDWGNYRWQAGKASGVVQAMRQLHDYNTKAQKNWQAQTYGLELADVDTLIRRAASARRNRT